MSDDAAFEALLQLHLTHARALRYVDGAIGGVHGLSTTELALLRAIGAAPERGIRPTELARELHLTGSGVTRALLPLEKRGIVERRADAGDGRASLVVLTGAGRTLTADTSASAAEAAARITRRLSLGQTRQLIRLLEEIG
jgi:DNA-binding MarR family transcriptional regulator